MDLSTFQARLLNVLSSINKNLSAIRISVSPPETNLILNPTDSTRIPEDSMNEKDKTRETVAAMRKLVASQKDIPPEFVRVLEDSFWDLL